jgi:uncharacterized membrane protein YadS
MQELSSQAPTLIKGLAAIIGEIVVGVNGPFLFERFGLNVPEAIASGVLVGAAVGVCAAAAILAVRHQEPATVRRHDVGVKVHLHRA